MRPILSLIGLILSQAALAEHKHDWHKVFGDIHIHQGDEVGSVRSVNGDIEMEDHTSASEVNTTNGRLRIGDFVTVEELATVNGSIITGHSLSLEGDAKTVNGNIRIKKNSKVGDSVRTVNGSIELTDTTVEHDLKTTNGDIELRGTTIVKGDIIFDEVSYSRWNKNHPTLRIDDDAEVHGTIYLKRKVNLKISEHATVGDIVRQYQ